MDKTEHKSFQAPDETREFPRGRSEILNIRRGQDEGQIAGWRLPSSPGDPDGRRRRVHPPATET